jgi:SAM-dependent methyltransferase
MQHPIHGGHLWRCDACESMFRHPVLRTSAYLDLYAGGAADEWSADDGREDLAIIRGIIAQNARTGAVLDVGCGAGDFLLTLPAELTKYGVEPSLAAAAAARARGVSVPAQTLSQLAPHAQFDVITIIDVIEHVADPGELLDQALPHLAPGGSLIIATGDAGNVLWRRVFRSRFWYSSFPEHVTFPSLRYFHIWHEGKELRAPTTIQLKYRHVPFGRAALYFASQMAYLMSPWLLNWVGRTIEWLRRAPRPRRRFFSPGAPGMFTDHQIVMIRRLS